MKKVILNIGLILTVIVFSKCSISKRHYRDGYQVTWSKNKIETKKQSEIESLKLLDIIEKSNINKPKNEEILYASLNNNLPQEIKSIKRNSIEFPQDSCGDLITLRNGNEIKAKVIEINQSTVKYKSCENLGGPLFVESIENIFMINYANGSKDVFKKPIANEIENNKPNNKSEKTPDGKSKKKINPMALVSLICCGAFFLYIPLAAAPIFALIACAQFKKQPDKYKAKGMVIPALIIGAIIITVLILILAGLILV